MIKLVAQEDVQKWKDQYKFVYKTSDSIYFRPLQRDEYTKLLTKQALDPTTFDHEMETSLVCVLGGIDEEELKSRSGLATILCEAIMQKSGFVQVDIEEV
jgi:hypothetical protein